MKKAKHAKREDKAALQKKAKKPKVAQSYKRWSQKPMAATPASKPDPAKPPVVEDHDSATPAPAQPANPPLVEGHDTMSPEGKAIFLPDGDHMTVAEEQRLRSDAYEHRDRSKDNIPTGDAPKDAPKVVPGVAQPTPRPEDKDGAKKP